MILSLDNPKDISCPLYSLRNQSDFSLSNVILTT